ncbi:MAG: GNAT family N-acetyltransferase [Butyrivibrio sp.]|nr:GNAT family N-acetyltransferase [Butyrivibrio sp.]
MTERIIDEELKLIPYYRNDEDSLPWYQDLDVCKQVDNRDEPYDLDLLHAMYDYLSSHGDCYYIEYKGTLVGDVSLRDNAEVAIVVCKEYQNQHIGRRCVEDMLKLAKEKGMDTVKANIYEEYDVIKEHTTKGHEVLKDISAVPELAVGALSHHERHDGKGYPNGLSGNDIPEVARIIAVADSFDAMYSDRQYRKQMDFEKVLSIIREVSGTQLNPEVVDAFFRLVDKGEIRAVEARETAGNESLPD